VNVKPDPVFGREGDNLTVTVPITFAEATLGADVVVPTPAGTTVKVRIAEGTQTGRVLRVRGKGATRKDGTKGDLLVTVDVIVPTKLDTKAREALAAFVDAMPKDDPRAELMRKAKRGE
jgi:molecular chaperone DnaJ